MLLLGRGYLPVSWVSGGLTSGRRYREPPNKGELRTGRAERVHLDRRRPRLCAWAGRVSTGGAAWDARWRWLRQGVTATGGQGGGGGRAAAFRQAAVRRPATALSIRYRGRASSFVVTDRRWRWPPAIVRLGWAGVNGRLVRREVLAEGKSVGYWATTRAIQTAPISAQLTIV